MRAVKIVRDPKAMELLADETRRRMIYLLRANEMSVSQIATQLQKTPQAIYHQIKKLTETGLAEVAREERSGHFIESYYRATAEMFQFQHGEGSADTQAGHTREALKSLAKLGLTSEINDSMVAEAVKLKNQMDIVGADPALEQTINNLEDVDFFAKQELFEYAKLASMNDEQFRQLQQIQSKFRELLKSTGRTEEPPKPRAN